jgi:hypothetical protein
VANTPPVVSTPPIVNIPVVNLNPGNRLGGDDVRKNKNKRKSGKRD